jgi:hypothetical protein
MGPGFTLKELWQAIAKDESNRGSGPDAISVEIQLARPQAENSIRPLLILSPSKPVSRSYCLTADQ